MVIDEDRVDVLTKFANKKGSKNIKRIESDHNLLLCELDINYTRKEPETRRELYNFKNKESLKQFYEETTNTNKLSKCFNGDKSIEQKGKLFEKTLMGIIHKCFKKIRIKTKAKQSDIQKKLDLRDSLKNIINTSNFI